MKRLAGLLVAAIIAALISMPFSAAAGPVGRTVNIYTYDGNHHTTAVATHAATERGPPTEFGIDIRGLFFRTFE